MTRMEPADRDDRFLPAGRLLEPGLGSAGKVLDVFDVDQPWVLPLGFEQVEHRFPVIRGRFHRPPAHPAGLTSSAASGSSGAVARRSHKGGLANLVRVPQTALKGTQRRSQNPTICDILRTKERRASGGTRVHFQSGTGRPARGLATIPMNSMPRRETLMPSGVAAAGRTQRH